MKGVAVHREKDQNRIPAEGTFIRKVLDAAMSPDGVSAKDHGFGKHTNSALVSLRDYYLFDVRTIDDPDFVRPSGHGGQHPARSWIVGRTYGVRYHDFIAKDPARYEKLLSVLGLV